MTTLLQIAENILLLSFIGFGYFLIETNRAMLGKLMANLLLGLVFGLTAALVTAVPVTLGDGATVDARAGPVILAGIVAGPVGAVIAGLMGAISRGMVGGSFAFSGVAVYVLYAVAGVVLGRLRFVAAESLLSLRAVAIVAVTSMLCASTVFFLIFPMQRALYWLQNDLPLIFVANTLSVAFTVFAISFAIIYLRNTRELTELNETLDLAKRAGGFGIWDYDIATGKLYWDELSREMHGVDSDSFTGSYEDWARNLHPDDLPKASQSFAHGLSGDSELDSEYRVLHPDGKQRWIKGNAIVLRDSNGEAVRVVGSNFDLTAIREAEAGLEEAQLVALQAQKVDTVGQLTGGIAHDFNNLLAVILGNLELLTMASREGAAFDDNMKNYVKQSSEAARRGAELTQNMLAYARKAQLKPVPLDLNEIVRQTEKWVGRMIESSVRLEVELQPELKLVSADKGSMQNALVNLILNARDAVESIGTVTIRTENVELEEKNGESAKGRYVMLSVADDGIGMDADTRERIFDPFFTTKPVGEGTGLGLSTVQGFVNQSKGFVQIESAPGQGATFRLFFPVADSPAPISDDVPLDRRGEAEPRDARILLVEDQPEVRDVVRKMLETAGYRLRTAESGDEAYEMCRSDSGYDLVVCDIVMPGNLQGPLLAKAIRQHHPDLPFIFMSGYSDYGTASSEEDLGDDVLLTKPVSQQELLDAIRKSLPSS